MKISQAEIDLFLAVHKQCENNLTILAWYVLDYNNGFQDEMMVKYSNVSFSTSSKYLGQAK